MSGSRIGGPEGRRAGSGPRSREAGGSTFAYATLSPWTREAGDA